MAKLKSGTRVYGDAQVDQTLSVGNITVSGNLVVTGTTTSVNSTVTQLQDPIFELGGGANGAALTSNDGQERGLLLHYYNAGAKDAFMGWHTTNGQFEFGKTATETSGNIVVNTYGNIKADRFIGEGDLLGNITGANVTGTVAFANVATYAGTVTTASQPNITSVGTLTGLTVGNGTANTAFGNGTITATGNITADYFLGNGSQLTGLLADTAKKTANGTSDVNIPTINGNITMSVGGTSNVVVVTSTGANITGTANVSGNLDAGNIKTTGTVEAANVKVTSLTSTRVTFAGTGGTLVDDADLTFDTTTNKLSAGNLDVAGTANLGTIKSTSLTEGKVAFVTTGNTIATDSQLSYDSSGDKLSTGNLEITTLANVGSAKIMDLTGTRVPFVNNSNTLVDSSTFTYSSSGDLLKVGNLELSGTSNVNEAIIRSLTSTRVPFVDTDQSLTDSTNFTFTTGTSKVNAGNLELTDTANVANAKVRALTTNAIPYTNSSNTLTADGSFTFEATGSLVKAANIEIATTANLLNVNVRSGGQITGNLIPSANATYSLGNATNSWKDLYLSGSTITLGVQTLSSDSSNITASNNFAATTLFATANANVTGNVNSGNVNSGDVYATGLVQGANITANTNVFTNDIRARVGGTSGITLTAGTGGTITLAPEGSGTVDVSNKKITNLATPTQATDAATKGYVDSTAQGLDVKNSVRAATTGNIALDGSVTTVDGVSVSNGDRVLVRAQSTGSENGIYVVNSAGWTRSDDASAAGEITGGTFTFVEEGTQYADTGWVVSTNGTIIIGTTAITWTQFSGAGAYTAGSGLTLTGGQFSVNTDGTTTAIVNGNVVVKDSAVFTTPNIGAATGTSLNLGTGIITANGSGLTSINGANVSLVNTAKQVTEGTQSNITAVGTLTSLAVSGNVSVGTGTVIANAGVYTDGYYYANGSPIDFQTAAGSATQIQYKSSSGNDLDASANLTFDATTSLFKVTGNANVTGQINTANILISGLTSGRVTYASTDGKLVDNANLTFDGSDLKVTGTANITSTITAGAGITATGNVRAGNLIADNLTTANALIISEGSTHRLISNANLFLGANETLTASNISTAGSVSAGSVDVTTNITLTSGNITGANVISGTTLTGTLSTATQTNITSVGTLSGLTATGTVNLTGASNVALGPVGNVHITGGSSGQVLTTDGSGVLTWATNDTSRIVNGTSNVSIPTADGNIVMVSGGNTVIQVTGTGANVTGYITATGDIQGNNITASNVILASGTVDATSAATGTIKTDGGISAKGNIYAGHSVGFANNNGGTTSKAYIQFNDTANSLDFIFN